MNKILRYFTLIAILITTIFLIPAISASALNYGQGTYGTCTYNTCGISITSSSNISVNITPNTSGTCSINNDNVVVTTDSSTGYSLTVSTNSSSNSLSNGSSNITSTAGTYSVPSTLGINQWGYRVDGVGGFGAGPTSAISNVAYPISTLFAGAPPNTGTATTIINTSSPANPAVTTKVWYGVCADTSLNSGTYNGTILYSATTN